MTARVLPFVPKLQDDLDQTIHDEDWIRETIALADRMIEELDWERTISGYIADDHLDGPE